MTETEFSGTLRIANPETPVMPDGAKKMFEYHILKWIFETKEIFWDNQHKEEARALRELGKSGWELTSIIFSEAKKTKVYYFKRQLTTPTK